MRGGGGVRVFSCPGLSGNLTFFEVSSYLGFQAGHVRIHVG